MRLALVRLALVVRLVVRPAQARQDMARLLAVPLVAVWLAARLALVRRLAIQWVARLALAAEVPRPMVRLALAAVWPAARLAQVRRLANPLAARLAVRSAVRPAPRRPVLMAHPAQVPAPPLAALVAVRLATARSLVARRAVPPAMTSAPTTVRYPATRHVAELLVPRPALVAAR
jgi:hypothetical protein